MDNEKYEKRGLPNYCDRKKKERKIEKETAHWKINKERKTEGQLDDERETKRARAPNLFEHV